MIEWYYWTGMGTNLCGCGLVKHKIPTASFMHSGNHVHLRKHNRCYYQVSNPATSEGKWRVLHINLTFIVPCIANIFADYNQQAATFHNLFISVRRSTCFRWVFRPSSGAQNCTLVWQILDALCAILSSWWWTENPSETCGASYRNK